MPPLDVIPQPNVVPMVTAKQIGCHKATFPLSNLAFHSQYPWCPTTSVRSLVIHGVSD